MKWSYEIDLKGGRIVKVEKDKKPVLGTFERIDGKTGNTHVCIPNFADEGMELGLPFHGPFRNLEWKIKFDRDGKKIIYVEDLGLRVEQTFEGGEKFSQEILIKNIGEKEQSVNVAIHNYLAVKNNWVGMKINGEHVTDEILDSLFIKAKKHNEIEFMEGEKLNIDVEGFEYFKLWTGFVEEEGQKVYDTDYVCVEPVRGKSGEYFGKKESMLKPGEEIRVKQEIY